MSSSTPGSLFRAWLISFTLLTLAADGSAEPGRRLALVVGNSDYQVAEGRLKNPANDAGDVARKLRELGFSVILRQNLEFAPMVKAFQEFIRMAPDYDVRLVYYAGHGIQFKDGNYLIPVDAHLTTESDIARQTFHFDQIVDRLAQWRSGVNIYILDACRQNPFTNVLAFGRDGRQIRLRGSTDAAASPAVGLAAPKPSGDGSFLAFSTTPGQLASDNPGERNSVYAKHLLVHLNSPGLTLEELFRRVRKAVKEETLGQQVPWEHTSLVEPFCFSVKAHLRCGS